METKNPIFPANPLAKIQASKKESKKPMKDIQLPPQTMQLEGEIEALKHEVLDLKGRLVVLDAEKRTWEEDN